MFAGPRLQKLISCHVRGGEKTKCDLFESLCEYVCRQRDTVLPLSESQTANYKNPKATSPPLSPRLPDSLPTSLLLSVSISISLLAFKLVLLFFFVCLCFTISVCTETSTSLVEVWRGCQERKGWEEAEEKGGGYREMKDEERGAEFRGDKRQEHMKGAKETAMERRRDIRGNR